jgi:hypothetical protein
MFDFVRFESVTDSQYKGLGRRCAAADTDPGHTFKPNRIQFIWPVDEICGNAGALGDFTESSAV